MAAIVNRPLPPTQVCVNLHPPVKPELFAHAAPHQGDNVWSAVRAQNRPSQLREKMLVVSCRWSVVSGSWVVGSGKWVVGSGWAGRRTASGVDLWQLGYGVPQIASINES